MVIVKWNGMKPNWAKIAEKRMREVGIQQVDLLSVFDVKTPGAVGHYFNGRREPSMQSLINLSQELGLAIGVLLGVSDNDAEESALKCTDAKYLTDAVTLLSRTIELNSKELKVFFEVFEKLGADNIVKATTALSEAGSDSSAQMNAVINIHDFMKKAG